jgi:hypothetical protein
VKDAFLPEVGIGDVPTVLELFAGKDAVLLVGRIPSLFWILALMFLMISDNL